MLTLKKNTTFTGTCTIDGVIAENYRASIDSENPEIPNMVTVPVKKELVYENLTECRANRAEFEDFIYAAYKEMTEESTEETSEETTDETAEDSEEESTETAAEESTEED